MEQSHVGAGGAGRCKPPLSACIDHHQSAGNWSGDNAGDRLGVFLTQRSRSSAAVAGALHSPTRALPRSHQNAADSSVGRMRFRDLRDCDNRELLTAGSHDISDGTAEQ